MKALMLATDLSNRSDRAMRRAARLARQFSCPWFILHVVDEDQPQLRVELEQEQVRRYFNGQLDFLTELAGRAPEIWVEVGDPAKHIADEDTGAGQAAGHALYHPFQGLELAVAAQPVLGRHARGDQGQPVGQPRLGVQHLVDPAREGFQGQRSVVFPVSGQAMVEEDIQQDAGDPSPFDGKALLGLEDQGVAVGEGVDPPVQADGRLDIRRPAPVQRPLDEVAIEAAEQLCRLRAAEVEVGEVVHGLRVTQRRFHHVG